MKKKLLLIICLSLVIFSQAFAQNHTVTGVVTAKDDGLPVPGVSKCQIHFTQFPESNY